MQKEKLLTRLSKGVFLLDGAMGTQIMAKALSTSKGSGQLNIEYPQDICDIHKAYFDAGCDAVLTNTFDANRIALSKHGLGDLINQINTKAAQIAIQASGGSKYVLGDIGPCGDFLEPIGLIKPDELKMVFAEQAKVLADAPIDGIVIETMTAIEEIEIAICAVKDVTDLPVFASMSFDKTSDGFRTMMGVEAQSAIEKIASLGVDAVGYNCGRMDMKDYVDLAKLFADTVKAIGSRALVFAEPNAGQPQMEGEKIVYRISDSDFALAAEQIYKCGVRIIGGCCGTTPKHLAAVAKRLK